MDEQELNAVAGRRLEGTAPEVAAPAATSAIASASDAAPRVLARLPDVNVPRPTARRVPLVRQVIRHCRQPRVLAIGGSAVVLVLVLAIGLHAVLRAKDRPAAASEDAPAWDSAATGVAPVKSAPVSATPAPNSQAMAAPSVSQPRPSVPPEGYRMAELPRPRFDTPDAATNAGPQPGVARLEGVILKPTADPSDERTGPGFH